MFNKLCLRRIKDANIFNYNTKEIIREESEKNSKKIRDYAKNSMIPLENYTMYVYGKNNQLVTLLSDRTKNFRGHEDLNIKGWSPLMFDYKNAIRDYPIKLYLPKDSDEFVIIRK